MTLFRFTFIRGYRRSADLWLFIALPALLLALPNPDWTHLPLGIQLFAFAIVYFAARMAHVLLEDRQRGLVIRIAAAPISHLGYLGQQLLAFLLLLLVQATVMVAGSLWLHALPAPLLIWLLYSWFALAALSFSLAWCSLFRNREASFLILLNVFILMAMLGGLLWPSVLLPLTLQRAAMLLPTYWLAEGLLHIAQGATLRTMIAPLTAMSFFSLACLLLGSRQRLS